MTLIISNLSGIPIYEQIKEQLKEAIMSGEYGEGDALPSLRQLAKDLKISVLTVTRAYTELEQEGYITVIQGKGAYVMPKGNEMIREQLLREVEKGLSTAITAAKKADLSKEETTEMINLLWEVDHYE